MSLISISSNDFSKLSKTAQTEILNLFKSNRSYEEADNDGELRYKEVAEVMSRLSQKSTRVLKKVVSFRNNRINLNDLIDILDEEDKDLKGVWSGITTSCRNVSNDSSFQLFSKTWSEEEDCYYLNFHPTTYAHISSFF